MKIKDESNFEEVMAAIKEIEGTKVEVGVIGESGKYSNGASVLDVALFNEYGTVNMPERPFIRGAYDSNIDKLVGEIDSDIDKVIGLKLPAAAAFKKTGMQGRDFTVEYLKKLSSPPNSPITIKMKGSSSPLIDTGQLMNSITYKVVK